MNNFKMFKDAGIIANDFNFCDNNKLEMKEILNLDGYIDVIFNQMWDIRINTDLGEILPGMHNTISNIKREIIIESGVPEDAINFVLKSAELRKLSYFIIKTGFKCGLFLCFAYKTMHMQLSEDV